MSHFLSYKVNETNKPGPYNKSCGILLSEIVRFSRFGLYFSSRKSVKTVFFFFNKIIFDCFGNEQKNDEKNIYLFIWRPFSTQNINGTYVLYTNPHTQYLSHEYTNIAVYSVSRSPFAQKKNYTFKC